MLFNVHMLQALFMRLAKLSWLPYSKRRWSTLGALHTLVSLGPASRLPSVVIKQGAYRHDEGSPKFIKRKVNFLGPPKVFREHHLNLLALGMDRQGSWCKHEELPILNTIRLAIKCLVIQHNLLLLLLKLLVYFLIFVQVLEDRWAAFLSWGAWTTVPFLLCLQSVFHLPDTCSASPGMHLSRWFHD